MKITTVEEETKEIKKKAPKKNPKEKVEKVVIPMGYTKIKLDSLGKLSAPFELHFRDYSIEEVMELASVTEDVENLETMIRVLNNMVFEDFDCGDLTLQELIEVVLILQGTYYSGSIEKRIKKDLSKEDSEDNYIDAFIPITKFSTKEIAEEFKEPFYLSDEKIKGSKYGFRLPRVKDKVVAEDYLKDKYKKEIRKFSSIYNDITKIESIINEESRLAAMEELRENKPDEIIEFQEYLFNKGKLMLALTQGLSLVSYNGEELEYGDCEKILELMPLISSRVWEKYTEILKTYNFGLEEEVTFYVPELQEEVTRRLSFRYLDFLPDNESKGDSGITFSFE